MKQYDLIPLKDNDNEYAKLSGSVEADYKGSWDDKVHDSYAGYVKHVQENSRRVHVIRCKAETIEKELDGLKIDDMTSLSLQLCREVDSI